MTRAMIGYRKKDESSIKKLDNLDVFNLLKLLPFYKKLDYTLKFIQQDIYLMELQLALLSDLCDE